MESLLAGGAFGFQVLRDGFTRGENSGTFSGFAKIAKGGATHEPFQET